MRQSHPSKLNRENRRRRSERMRRPRFESLEVRTLMSVADLLGPASARGAYEHDHDHEAHTETHVIGGVGYQFVADPAPEFSGGDGSMGSDLATASSTSLYPLTSIPVLNSRPGATATLYLDFDGHYQASWGAWSNITTPVYDVDGDESTFSDAELSTIEAVWRAVSEDYAPFNINVTTVQPAVLAPGASATAANKVAQRIAIGGNSDWLGANWGGYSYISSFTNSMPNVSYVFAADIDNINWMGLTVSHEAGHSFGLQHQSTYDASGVLVSEYNHGTTTWAPIMGTTWYATQTTTWHNGTSRVSSTTYQDDMAVIANTTNGFGYRADDHANAASSATNLTASGSTWSGSGIVAQNSDVDYFKFTVSVGDTLRIAAKGLAEWANLDTALELRNAAGTLLATASPTTSTAASIIRYLAAGVYTAAVKTSGVYGWVGQYTVNIDAPPAGITVKPGSPVLTTGEDGRATSFTVALDTSPTGAVTIPVWSSNSAEGIVSTSSLVFNSSNWDVPQTVTVTGMADGVLDGDAAYSIILGAASSADPDYQGRDAVDPSIVNIDVDAAGWIYRVDTSNDWIIRTNLSGTQSEVVVDLKAVFGASINYNPRSPVVDLAEKKLYWIDASTYDVYRSNLDGSGAIVLVARDSGGPYGLAIDLVGRKLYWPEYGAGILRANLDGSNVETFVATPNSLKSLAVDSLNGKLYYTDVTADAIVRVNLDGTSQQVLFSNPDIYFNGGLTLDVEAGKMYWTSPWQGVIQRANLDGSDVETLVDLKATNGSGAGSQAYSFGITLDPAAGKMYWTDFVTKGIYRANLDGSNVAILASGLGSVDGLVLVPQSPGFSVNPKTGLTTTEAGGSATFTVALTMKPTANVTISVSTSDATEGTASVSSLTFTPANWNVPQTVTITGVNDSIYDLDVAYTILLGAASSADPNYNGIDPADVSVVNADNDPPPTKFYVVDDGGTDRTYEYASAGIAVENYALNSGNTASRGAASTAAGDKVWVVDANKNVYVYNTSGVLLGSWTAGGLASNATVEGIATNGTDVWIVDARQDKVFRYTGAATRLSGSQTAASSFNLNSSNTGPKDIVTDGTNLWVVNEASTDKVFKYSLSGSLAGSWTISGAGSSPTGITLDPAGGGTLWIVDSGTDRVYQFDNARSRTTGSQSPSTSFALAAGNTNPQGIADPPADSRRPGGGASLHDAALDSLFRNRPARQDVADSSTWMGADPLAMPTTDWLVPRKKSRPGRRD